MPKIHHMKEEMSFHHGQYTTQTIILNMHNADGKTENESAKNIINWKQNSNKSN
jgi:hypothetical protein